MIPGKANRSLTPPAPLQDTHKIAGFDCGESALDDWLIRRARKAEARSARTYVVCDDDRVIGYYTFANAAVMRAGLPSGLTRALPDTVPMTLLARLAVDRAWQGRGIGAGMLKDGLARALQASRIIGSYGVLVHAIDVTAAGFYRHFGFVALPGAPRSLVLPMKTLLANL